MINGKFKCIDAHCHIYPDKIARLAVNHTDEFYKVKSRYSGTVESLIKHGQKCGVDKFIVQSVATTPHQVRSINEFIKKQVDENKEYLVGLGTVHPESQDYKGDVNHLVEMGLKGIKIHPDIQNFHVDDSRFMQIYEYMQEFNLTLLMHSGDSRYDNSNPNRIIPILKAFPNLKVVGAHFGGWSIWEEASKELCKYPNFFVDTSSSLAYITSATAKEIILRYGIDKVMFASDYPMWGIKDDILKLLSLNLSDDDFSKMFYENAVKIYNL